MNKKGYTKIELLILIVLLGIVFFVSMNKVSYAFVDNSKELYDNELKLIKTCASKYGESKKDEIHSSVTGLKIDVDELVKFGCLKSVNKDGKYIFSNEELNNISLNLSYNTQNDQIEVEVLK